MAQIKRRNLLRKNWPAIRGSGGFVEQAHLRSNGQSKEVRRDRDQDVVSAEAIIQVVARRLGCTKAELLKVKRGRAADNRGRGMAMKLCQEMGSMKLSDMAELFGVGSDSAVSRSVSRLTEILNRDSDVSELYNSICKDLTP